MDDDYVASYDWLRPYLEEQVAVRMGRQNVAHIRGEHLRNRRGRRHGRRGDKIMSVSISVLAAGNIIPCPSNVRMRRGDAHGGRRPAAAACQHALVAATVARTSGGGATRHTLDTPDAS